MNDIPSMIRSVIQTRQELWNEAKALQVRGNLSDTENRRFDELCAEIEALDARADELHNLHQENLKMDEQRKPYEDVVRHGGESSSAREWTRNINAGKYGKKTDEELALRDFFLGDEPRSHFEIDFSGMEHRTNDAGQVEVRDLSTTTGSSGLVGEDFRRTLYAHLVEENALIRAGATLLNTSHGRDVKIPKTTTAGTAAIVGEGSAISEADGGFGSTTVGAWKYARLQQATRELIEDSEVDLVQYLARDMGRSAALASGAHFVTGSGTNQPYGLVTATLAQVGTAVQGTASTIEADDLIDLYFSVSTPYRERGAWFMNSDTFGAIRKLKDSNNNYLMGPLGAMGAPTLLGAPVVIERSVASVGSANASVAFGDPAAYFIRQAPLRVERSDDFAFNLDLVTWRVIYRADGDLVDATGAVKVLDTD